MYQRNCKIVATINVHSRDQASSYNVSYRNIYELFIEIGKEYGIALKHVQL